MIDDDYISKSMEEKTYTQARVVHAVLQCGWLSLLSKRHPPTPQTQKDTFGCTMAGT